jgi:hypothetical protein
MQQFSGKWVSISHTVMAYSTLMHAGFDYEIANIYQVPSSEPWLLACMRHSPHDPSTPRLNAASYLHYHKIVENEFYVSTLHGRGNTVYSQQ